MNEATQVMNEATFTAAPAGVPDDWHRRADWLLYQVNPNAGRVRLLHLQSDELRLAPFHDERLGAWLGRAPAECPIDRLPEPAPSPAAPVILLHSAFCCSTLLSRLLDEVPATYSLREPTLLRDAAMALTAGQRAHGALGRLLRLLLAVPDQHQRVIVKPSNVASPLVSLLREVFPGLHCLVLTDSMEAFLVSVLNKTPETQAKMPGMARYFLRALGLESRVAVSGSMLEAAALAWAAQRALLVRIASDRPWLSATRLLERNHEILGRILAALELPADPASVDRVASSAHWQRHAKAPQQRWGAIEKAAQDRRLGRAHRASIERAADRAHAAMAGIALDPPDRCWV